MIKSFMICLTLTSIVLLADCSNANDMSELNVISTISNTSRSLVTTVRTNKNSEHASKGSIFSGNYAIFGAAQMRDGNLKQEPYTLHVVTKFDRSRPHLSSPAMIWLTRKLEQIPCTHSPTGTKCYKETIVDVAEVQPNKMFESVIMPDQLVPCTWHDAPILALLGKAEKDTSQLVLATWGFDLVNEKIIAIPPNEANCQNLFDEETRKRRASEFLTDGWLAIRSYKPINNLKEFRQLKKVIREDKQLTPNEYDSSQKNEIHNFQYEGMSISVYLARFNGNEKIIVSEVVISSSSWPVKYNLTVGSSKREVEELLGKNMQLNSREDEWAFGEGMSDLTFTFDERNNVKSIRWYHDID